MVTRRCRWLYILSFFSSTLFADPRFERDEIVVFGAREDAVSSIAKNVSVITRSELEVASSANITDVLAREANVVPVSFFGTDKFASVDIRGGGINAPSNVLVLIDGVRLNAADETGADFTSLPINQIERIDVIRGANSARFGDGAVNGVVNLITRKDLESNEFRGNVSFRAASFNTYETRIGGRKQLGKADLRFAASHYDSDGYRQNNALRKQDFNVGFRYAPTDWFAADLGAAFHYDEYGLPGPIQRDEFFLSEDDRRASSRAFDRGETLDRRYRIGLELTPSDADTLQFHANYRNRNNPFLIGVNINESLAPQRDEIREETLTLDFSYLRSIQLSMANIFLGVGVDHRRSDYVRAENGTGFLDRSREQIGDVSYTSAFLSVDVESDVGLGLNLAYRKGRFAQARRTASLRSTNCDFFFDPITFETRQFNCQGTIDVADRRNDAFKNEAVDVGLTYRHNERYAVFVNYAESFRNPNVDELALASEFLGSQSGRNWEVGVTVTPAEWANFELTVFESRTMDEIFFHAGSRDRTSI